MICVLAEIDQDMEIARSQATNPFLDEQERQYAVARLDIRRRWASSVERMCWQLGGRSRPIRDAELAQDVPDVF